MLNNKEVFQLPQHARDLRGVAGLHNDDVKYQIQLTSIRILTVWSHKNPVCEILLILRSAQKLVTIQVNVGGGYT